MGEPFSERARRCIVLAQEEAQRCGVGYIGDEHLLVAFLAEGDNLAAGVLTGFGITLEKARAEVKLLAPREKQSAPQEMVFSAAAKRIIERAFEEARALGDDYLAAHHLLLGTLRETNGVALRALEALGADPVEIRIAMLAAVKATPAERSPAPSERAEGPSPTTVGLLPGEDRAFADAVIAALKAAGLTVFERHEPEADLAAGFQATRDYVAMALRRAQALVVILPPEGGESGASHASERTAVFEAGLVLGIAQWRAILVHPAHPRSAVARATLPALEFDGSAASRERLGALLRRAGCAANG